MIRAAAEVPKHRRPTRPSLGAKKRRLESKAVRSGTKTMRRKPENDS
jgi:ribosome-associated protein